MKTPASNTSETRFNASLDNLSKVISWAFPFIIATIVMVQYYYAYDSAFPVFMLLFLSIIYLFALVFAPQYYVVHTEGIRINRIFKNVNISKNNIQHIEIIPREKISNAWRLFGVGGLFGYYGLFYNSQMGTMTFYATRTSNAILIKTTKNQKIILTPDTPEHFLAKYQKINKSE